MKVLAVWFITFVVCVIGVIAIVNIDDLRSVFREESLWWHIPAFFICGWTVITSGTIIINRIFGW